MLGLKEWQRARILGSKAKANEALKTGDITGVFNAMKPERYKVKSISEVAQFQKQNGTISPLKQPDEVNKANEVAQYQKNKKYSQSEIDSVINELKLKQGAQMPEKISIDEFIKTAPFKNSENLIKHILIRPNEKEAQNRINNLANAILTYKKSDFKYNIYEVDKSTKVKILKTKYIKKIGKKYALISISENDKIVRTFINDYKVSKLRKELLKAIKWHPSTSSANLAKAGHSDNK